MAEEALTLEPPQVDEFSSAGRLPTTGGLSLEPGGNAITSGMADIQSKKLGEETKVFAETERRVEADRAYMADRMKAQGLEAEKLKPWNHEEEQKKFQHSPLEAFGSLGSVVGILASAFTRAPMENAFGASAAAMNAVKAGDDEGFKRAFESYKVNTDLVVKREAMIQNGFNDAAALMRTDMAAGTAKAQNIATKYGDQQALFLLQNGMSKELFEMMSARADATRKMAEANEKITQMTFQKNQFEAMQAGLPEEQRTPQRLMAMWNYSHGMNTTEEERYMEQWWAEHKGATFEQAATAAAKFKSESRSSGIQTPDRMDAREIERRRDQYVKEGADPAEAYDKAAKEVREISAANKRTAVQEFIKRRQEAYPDEEPEEFSKAVQEFVRGQKAPAAGAGGNQELTGTRHVNAQVIDYEKRLREQGKPDGTKYTEDEIADKGAERRKELSTKSAAVTGNQQDKLQGMINQTNYFDEHMNNADKLLQKHNAITGLGGKLTRPAEVIGNIFGSNEADRAQFRREVLGMQELAGRILTGSAGRPLAAEASKLEGIIAGLAAGDTKTNTLRAYEELRPLIKKIREDLAKRKGDPAAAGSGAAPAAGGGENKPKWMQAPVVEPPPAGGKRSDAGGEMEIAEGSLADDMEFSSANLRADSFDSRFSAVNDRPESLKERVQLSGKAKLSDRDATMIEQLIKRGVLIAPRGWADKR